MKFGVPSLALCCLLRWFWCCPVFSLWNIACSLMTFECMRVWYLVTHHGNYTRGVCIGGWQWQHSASDQTPNSGEPQICTGGFSTVIWLRPGAEIVDKHKACQTAAYLCLPECYRVVKWCPSSSTLSWCLVKELLVGHTRSISDPILRWRDFRLTTSSILYEKICYWCRVGLLCTPPSGIPTLPQRPSVRGPHNANALQFAPNEVVNKQWYCAYYL